VDKKRPGGALAHSYGAVHLNPAKWRKSSIVARSPERTAYADAPPRAAKAEH